MGKKKWFSSMKKVLSPSFKKDQKDKKLKSDEVDHGKKEDLEVTLPNEGATFGVTQHAVIEDIKLSGMEDVESKYAYSLALATAAAAEAAAAAAQAAAEVVRLTSVSRLRGKSKEDLAALKIQTAYRGYLARRKLRGMKGLARLRSLIRGKSVKRQSASALRCMQTLTRLQSQVHERRAKMSEENQTIQREMQLRHEKELEKLQAAQIAEDWDDTALSKEQIAARQSKRQEATVRRERALAYAYSHQQKWRNSSKPAHPTTFTDPKNPHWGWSWLDRWEVPQQGLDNQNGMMVHNQHASSNNQSLSIGDITEIYISRGSIPYNNNNNNNNNNNKPYLTNQKSSRPPSRRPSVPLQKAPSVPSISRKVRSPSLKSSSLGRDNDLMGAIGSQSRRRHTITGSSLGDNESIASSSTISSCTVPTKSAKAKSRTESAGISRTPEKGSSVKKRLSLTDSSPSRMRNFSGPLKRDILASATRKKVANGGRL